MKRAFTVTGLFGTLLLATLFSALCSPDVHANSVGRDELVLAWPGSATVDDAPTASGRVIRQAKVNIELPALQKLKSKATASAASLGVISLWPFADVNLQIDIRSVEPTLSGGFAYVGQVRDAPNSLAVLVDNAGVVSMHINTVAHSYVITGSQAEGYLAKELAEQTRRDHPLEPPVSPFQLGLADQKRQTEVVPAAKSGAGNLETAAPDTGASLDVMIVYTKAALTANGGLAQIRANIDAQVALTNAVYANSNVVQRLRLVYRGEVAYSEVNMNTDLPRLANKSDGYLDEVPKLRDIYKADFVSMWGVYTDYCGLGYTMTTESAGFSEAAYNIVSSPDCTTGNAYTLAHELGHNMGLLHDNFQENTAETTVTPEAGGAATKITYAHGYIDLANRFRTVMSYNDQCVAQGFNCTRIPYFSNPSINFTNAAGYAAAVSAAIGDAVKAHERQALNDTRETTANFRTALASLTGPGIFGFASINANVSEAAGTMQIGVSRHLGAIGTVSVSYSTANGTAIAGQDYGAVSGVLTWADGDNNDKFIAVPITQNTLNAARITFSLTLSNATGGGSIDAGLVKANVTIIGVEADNFPSACNMPVGWAAVSGAETTWSVATDDFYRPTCSVKSISPGDAKTTDGTTKSQIQVTAAFLAGTISFARRVSSEQNWDCFRFSIDGVLQAVGAGGATATCRGSSGASGEVPWGELSFPITAGTHTLIWSYEKDDSTAEGGDAVWIDSVVLPLKTSVSQPFNLSGDGKSTLTWVNTNGAVTFWRYNGSAFVDTGVTIGPFPGWSLLTAEGDFDGDGKSDLLWLRSDGAISIWLMDGTTVKSQSQAGPYAGWSLFSANSDFNGDGKTDLIWQRTDGAVSLWAMNGGALLDERVHGPFAGWRLLSGNNDFDGDGKSDLLWKRDTGSASLWLMNGVNTKQVSAEYGPFPGWTVVSGSSDYNGDGKTDLTWEKSDNAVSVWLMNGTTSTAQSAQLGPFTGWRIVAGKRDFDADGKSDLLWQRTDGAASVWLMNGVASPPNASISAAILPTGTGWQLLATRTDFNGDGKTDLVWQSAAGQVAVGLANGVVPPAPSLFGPFAGWSHFVGRTIP